ncbi:MAG: DUF5671 domain-containing protein [Anaerolineae bacterium]
MLNLYLYSVSAVSLAAFYVAALGFAANALALAFGLEGGPDIRHTVATAAGVVVASFPMWAIHWRWLRRQFGRATKNEVLLHRFYLFTIICLSAMAMLVSGSAAVSQLAGLLLGLTDTAAAGVQKGLAALATLGLSAGLWLHHWRQFGGRVGPFLPSPSPAEAAEVQA